MILPQRILVVEDHEPFRRVLCALLRQRTDVLVVEAADGLSALEEARTFQPDVVLLDIGLPGLSGIEVAGRLRAIIPRAKIVLVTNEISADVIEEAFRQGAHGYVHKPRAMRDLLPVLDAVVHGGHVVSGSLDRIARGDASAAHRHSVLFWSTDAVFVDGFSRFIARALRDSQDVLALVTKAHEEAIVRNLRRASVDVDAVLANEQCVFINNHQVLSSLVVNGRLDERRFLEAVNDVVIPAADRAKRGHRRLAACGECAPTLWARGDVDAAIELERLWDSHVANRHHVDTLCAYPSTALREHTRAARRLCAEHTAVEIR